MPLVSNAALEFSKINEVTSGKSSFLHQALTAKWMAWSEKSLTVTEASGSGSILVLVCKSSKRVSLASLMLVS